MITIARTARTKGVDVFPTTGMSVDMFPHTDGILDMFPHTGDIHTAVSGHVEVVSLLQRVSNTRSKVITLDVEMDDYYMIKTRDGGESDG